MSETEQFVFERQGIPHWRASGSGQPKAPWFRSFSALANLPVAEAPRRDAVPLPAGREMQEFSEDKDFSWYQGRPTKRTPASPDESAESPLVTRTEFAPPPAASAPLPEVHMVEVPWPKSELPFWPSAPAPPPVFHDRIREQRQDLLDFPETPPAAAGPSLAQLAPDDPRVATEKTRDPLVIERQIVKTIGEPAVTREIRQIARTEQPSLRLPSSQRPAAKVRLLRSTETFVTHSSSEVHGTVPAPASPAMKDVQTWPLAAGERPETLAPYTAPKTQMGGDARSEPPAVPAIRFGDYERRSKAAPVRRVHIGTVHVTVNASTPVRTLTSLAPATASSPLPPERRVDSDFVSPWANYHQIFD